MGKKNQYLDNLVPHLREKYGTTQAEAIITSAWTSGSSFLYITAYRPFITIFRGS